MAVDYFLKVEGAPGESQDSKHPNEIQLESFSFGTTQTGTFGAGGGGGGGKANFQDFHFTMKVNKASPVLFLKCATGTHIPTAFLTCRKVGGKQEEFVKWKFTDLLVGSFTTSGHGAGDDLPMESVSLNFAQLEVEYAEQNKDGSLKAPVKAGYNLKKADKV